MSSQSACLLVTYGIVFLATHTTGLQNVTDIAFESTISPPETSRNDIVLNDNISETDSFVLIHTFFDLFWYCIGLIVFCICCISCLLLFYLQQTRRSDHNIKIQTSVHSLPDTELPYPQSYSRQTSHTNSHLSSHKSMHTPSPQLPHKPHKPKHRHNTTPLSNSSLTHSVKRNSLFGNSFHTKRNTFSAYSISAFSGVDSQGIDLDSSVMTNSNMFTDLGLIADECEPSRTSTQSSHSFHEPQPKTFSVTTVNTDFKSRIASEESTDGEESSLESSTVMTVDPNGASILSKMKKRSAKVYETYDKMYKV